MDNFILLPMANAPPAPPGGKNKPASSGDPPFASVLEETRKDRPDDSDFELVAQALPPPNQDVVAKAPDSGSNHEQVSTPPVDAQGSHGQAGDAAAQLPLLGNPGIIPEQVVAPEGLIFLGEEDGNLIETPQFDLVNDEKGGSPIETPKFDLANLGPQPIEDPAAGEQQPVIGRLIEASTTDPVSGESQISLQPDAQSAPRMSEVVLSAEKPAAAPIVAAEPEHLSDAGNNASAFSHNDFSEPELLQGANKSPPDGDQVQAMLGTETAKIQTAEHNIFEPARLAEAQNPKLVSQLAQGLETLSKSGHPSLRLQLYPQNLGKVDLRIYSGADGLHLTLSAAQPETGALLERYLPELRQALVEAGVNLGRLAVGSASTQGNPSNSEQWNSENRPATSSLTHIPDQPDQPEEAASNPRTWSSSNVDYLI